MPGEKFDEFAKRKACLGQAFVIPSMASVGQDDQVNVLAQRDQVIDKVQGVLP